MTGSGKKTLGSAIDEIVSALEGLDESSRATAVRAACEHLGISALLGGAAPPGESGDGAHPENAGGAPVIPLSSPVGDLRSLKAQKNPSNAFEMACIVAYYLGSLAPPSERKRDISSADIEKYFIQGGYPLPKRIQQLLVDARSSGYFDSTGHGKYRLNPVGHNLVVHNLPKKK